MVEKVRDLWAWLGICQRTLKVTPVLRQVWILSREDMRAGYIRPLRYRFVHQSCGAEITLGLSAAKVWARSPGYYRKAYCPRCNGSFQTGAKGQFVWKGSEEKVGT